MTRQSTSVRGGDDAAATVPIGSESIDTPPEPQPKTQIRALSYRMIFFLTISASVISALSIAVAFSTWRINQVSNAAILTDLAKTPSALDYSLTEIASRGTAILRSLSEEPGTKALMGAEVSPLTLSQWTTDTATLLRANTVFLFDRGGRLIGTSRENLVPTLGTSFGDVPWVGEVLSTGEPSHASIREERIISTIVSVPVVSGFGQETRLEGVLSASFPFDSERLYALAGLISCEVGLAANLAKAGAKISAAVVHETSDFHGALTLASLSQSDALNRLLVAGENLGPSSISVRGERRQVVGIPIRSATGRPVGALIVSRSSSEAAATYRAIESTLLGVGILAIVLAIPLALILGRHFAKPLEELAATAAAIRHGNLDLKFGSRGAHEVGVLSHAFEEMVAELKQKRALERLLGEIHRTSSRPGRKEPKARLAHRIGDVLADRYVLVEVLGAGGMGAVFRAQDRQLEEEVALKLVIHRSRTVQADLAERFKHEIKLARQVTHHNVARTYDYGQDNDDIFLTMELVAGTTLHDIIDSRGAIELEAGLQLAKQLCRGLGAVHRAGIVHRDMKSRNVLVLPTGLLKLTDFGISRSLSGGDTLSDRLTIGTPAFMSPEQFRNESPTFQTDIYSLGVILFEIFAGQRPFPGPSGGDFERQHIGHEPPVLWRIRPGVPVALSNVILQCLAKSPQSRPASARALFGRLMDLHNTQKMPRLEPSPGAGD